MTLYFSVKHNGDGNNGDTSEYHTYVPYIHLHTHARTYVHTYVYTHTHTYVHTYVYTHTHTYVHTYVHTHTHFFIYILGIHECSGEEGAGGAGQDRGGAAKADRAEHEAARARQQGQR